MIVSEYEKPIGRLPIMVGSQLCHLAGKTPQEMLSLKEEKHEFGGIRDLIHMSFMWLKTDLGYFIVNGNEKIVRLLIAQRRNYPMCFTRGTPLL